MNRVLLYTTIALLNSLLATLVSSQSVISENNIASWFNTQPKTVKLEVTFKGCFMTSGDGKIQMLGLDQNYGEIQRRSRIVFRGGTLSDRANYVLPKYFPCLRSIPKAEHGWLYDQPIYNKRDSLVSSLSDDLPPPPGFVGSRGRRGEALPNEIELRNTLISKMAKNMGISPLLLLDRLRQNDSKKKDLLLPYKDAFMGSRG